MNPKKDMTPPVSKKQYHAPEKFRKQLSAVLSVYLKLKDAVFRNNVKLSDKIAKEFEKKLTKVDMSLVKGDAHMVWMEHLGRMNKGLEKFVAASDLKGKRSYFAVLSAGLITALERFGHHESKKVFRFECTMALDGKGAVWLQDNKKTQNPYYGEGGSMPGCHTGLNEIPQKPEISDTEKKMKEGQSHEY